MNFLRSLRLQTLQTPALMKQLLLEPRKPLMNKTVASTKLTFADKYLKLHSCKSYNCARIIALCDIYVIFVRLALKSQRFNPPTPPPPLPKLLCCSVIKVISLLFPALAGDKEVNLRLKKLILGHAFKENGVNHINAGLLSPRVRFLRPVQ